MKKHLYLVAITTLIVTVLCAGFAFASEIYGIKLANKEEVTPTPKNTEINLTFAGDCTLGTNQNGSYQGSFNQVAKVKPPTYFLEEAAPYFQNDDFSLVNFETVLSDQNIPMRKKSNGTNAFWFKGATSHTDILTMSGVDGVSLANNHAFDYGEAGKTDTINAVSQAELEYGTDDRTIVYEKDGFVIGILCVEMYYEDDVDAIIQRMNAIGDYTDYQIIFFHGGREAVHQADEWKVRACQKMVRNGADLVIGSHPHVLQPVENYKGVDIIYSLGNFSFGGNRKPENRTMIMQYNIKVEDGKVTGTPNFIPFYVYEGKTNNWRPAEITNETEIQKVHDFLNGKRSRPY